MAMQIEVVPIDSIIQDPFNLRKHNARNLDTIKASLIEYGQQKPIIVDSNSIIRAGNGTHEGAKQLGWTEIQIVRSSLTGPRAQAYGIVDNRSTDLSTFEPDIGRVLKKLMDAEVVALEALGYTREEVLKLYPDKTPAPDPGPQTDRAAEWQEKWQINPGDLWEIPSLTCPGQVHRLYCGDSTNPDHIAKLFASPVNKSKKKAKQGERERAAILSTDPPYGIGLGQDTATLQDRMIKSGSPMLNDENDGPQLQGFIAKVLTAWKPHLTANPALYLWHAQAKAIYIKLALDSLDIKIHRYIIWSKSHFSLGRGDYHYKHEAAVYGWFNHHRAPWYGDRTQATIWMLENNSDPEAVLKRILAQSSTWEIGQENDKIHPTQKPVEIFARPLRLSTRMLEICAEPFTGSGSQFIAAEQESRLCRGMELHPPYVASTLERLSQMGLAPELKDTV